MTRSKGVDTWGRVFPADNAVQMTEGRGMCVLGVCRKEPTARPRDLSQTKWGVMEALGGSPGDTDPPEYECGALPIICYYY